MKNFITITLYTLLCLVLLDLGVGYIAKYPENPFENSPSTIQTYFNKGLSVTGRLKQMISEHGVSGRAKNGWIGTQYASDTLKAELNVPNLKIRIYGMSFSNHLGEAIHKLKPDAEVMLFHGGGAPPNHALGAFLKDSTKNSADIAVLGVHSSGVFGILCNTGLTWNFDIVRPFTYSVFTEKDGKTLENQSPIISLNDFKHTLYNNAKFKEYLSYMKNNDPYYSSFLVEETFWDKSLLYRLIRKGYASSYIRNVNSKYYSAKDGIIQNSEVSHSLKAIYKRFSDEARENKLIPVVFLINTTGYSDHLHEFSKDYLDKNQIAYISTHFSAPVEKREFFLEDGHFTKEANGIFAKELLDILKKN